MIQQRIAKENIREQNLTKINDYDHDTNLTNLELPHSLLSRSLYQADLRLAEAKGGEKWMRDGVSQESPLLRNR